MKAKFMGAAPQRKEFPEKVARPVDWASLLNDLEAKLARLRDRKARLESRGWVEQAELRDRLGERSRNLGGDCFGDLKCKGGPSSASRDRPYGIRREPKTKARRKETGRGSAQHPFEVQFQWNGLGCSLESLLGGPRIKFARKDFHVDSHIEPG
jgi:hypothetical protein